MSNRYKILGPCFADECNDYWDFVSSVDLAKEYNFRDDKEETLVVLSFDRGGASQSISVTLDNWRRVCTAVEDLNCEWNGE